MTPSNLGKISQNFSNIAKEVGDVSSDDDDHGYLSYMNISQSPEEIQKRLRRDSNAQYTDSASVTGKSHRGTGGYISAAKAKEPMTGTKNKSILKKTSSNQFVKE